MTERLRDIDTIVKTADEPEEASEFLYSVVKENTFNFPDEIDNAVVLLGAITKMAYKKKPTLMKSLQTANIVSGAATKVEQTQKCLDIVDDIGRNSEEPITLADEGLAVMSVDVETEFSE